MISPTYGEVSLKEIVKIIDEYVKAGHGEEIRVLVGTDSQNFDNTKAVLVIAVQRVGKGGIFFYEVSRVKKIANIRQKLYFETQMSLSCADRLMQEFERHNRDTGFQYSKLTFGIHVDAGTKGKSTCVLSEIIAWVNSCGFDCAVKPDSFVASTIADKISK